MSSILEEIETQIAGLKTSTTKSNVGVVREAGDALASAKVDAEALPDVSERFEIRSLPTTLLFRNGALADRITGFATAGALRAWLQKNGVGTAA